MEADQPFVRDCWGSLSSGYAICLPNLSTNLFTMFTTIYLALSSPTSVEFIAHVWALPLNLDSLISSACSCIFKYTQVLHQIILYEGVEILF